MDSASYQAGQTKGQAQEKASSLMDKAGNAAPAQSAKESVQDVINKLDSRCRLRHKISSFGFIMVVFFACMFPVHVERGKSFSSKEVNKFLL
ncbi:hypothetical protein AAHA92_18417 [Salvia divinorum]|uniref:Uncharacterized protein n=1 Tax=Salvia divinorum TaxID=28513 RepID=A0ABD1H4U1_SALDI